MYGYCFVDKRYSNMVKTILTVVIVTAEGAYMSICKSLGPKKSSQYCMDFWIIKVKGRDYRVNFPFYIVIIFTSVFIYFIHSGKFGMLTAI